MFRIKNLFEATRNDPEEVTFILPELLPPSENSIEQKKDIESVMFYYTNPCLRGGFLDSSHDSVKNIFKKYCRESGYRVDWGEIKSLLKRLENVNRSLKNKFKRLRPKHVLADQSHAYDNIHDMESYSYPSGHTSTAYFISSVLSSQFPDARADLENIAALIGQSRIENGVHYPSDVSYGRLVGEYCADYFLEKEENCNFSKDRKRKHNKQFSLFLRSLDGNLNKTAKSMANFLYRTLQIEGLNSSITYSECIDAAKKLMSGLDDKYLSENFLIRSQCKGLREAFFVGTFSPEMCVRIHKQMSNKDLEKGNPGEFRNYSHYSPAGVKYCEPGDLFSTLKKITSFSNPTLRHALFEWIHPFFDGNGRTGRIILCHDTGYDFDKVNRLISNKYIENLNNFYANNDVGKYLA